jgi:hypothetical protein
MAYKLIFHCGAELEVGSSPRSRKKYKGVGRTTARDGLLRVVVCSFQPGGKAFRVKLPDGSRAPCYECRGLRRKSGRVAYFCYPKDWEQENKAGGKYHGKPFIKCAEQVIACFPVKVERVDVNQTTKLIKGMV